MKSTVEGKYHIMEWKVQELILQEKTNASIVIDIALSFPLLYFQTLRRLCI